MSIWTRSTPPTFAPHAVAGKNGWIHPVTGEILEVFGNSDSAPTVASSACQSVKLLGGFVAASGEVIVDPRTSLITGDYIRFAARFNTEVIVVGSPYVTLVIDGDTVHAAYVSGSGTPTLIFQYRILDTNSSAAGDVSVTSPIQLNSGTIKDVDGNTSTKTFTPPDLTAIAVN